MPRETKKLKRERGIETCRRLHALYPHVESALDYRSAYTLLVAVMLSAQTTDAAVNKVTPELFKRWPDPVAMASASKAEVGELIRTIGFWRAKASHCVEMAQMLVADYGGEVPNTMNELVKLPGVGRKTANIVLNKMFDTVDGIAVDTHVYRIASRLRLTSAATPLAAEQDLLALLPRKLWKDVNEEWIHFGRETCSARNPSCETCPLADICPSFEQPNRWFKGGGEKNSRRRSSS